MDEEKDRALQAVSSMHCSMQHTFVSRSSRLFAGPTSLAVGSNTTILGWGLVTVQLAQSLQQVGHLSGP